MIYRFCNSSVTTSQKLLFMKSLGALPVCLSFKIQRRDVECHQTRNFCSKVLLLCKEHMLYYVFMKTFQEFRADCGPFSRLQRRLVVLSGGHISSPLRPTHWQGPQPVHTAKISHIVIIIIDVVVPRTEIASALFTLEKIDQNFFRVKGGGMPFTRVNDHVRKINF